MSDPLAVYTKTRDQIAAARERRLSEMVDQNRILRKPFRAVDNQDWDYILGALGYGGRARFWKSVLTEMRDALNTVAVEEKPELSTPQLKQRGSQK